jgi:hypothetical protein
MAAEAEVNLRSNGTQTPVSAAMKVIKYTRYNKQNNRGQLTVGLGGLYSGA